MANTIIFECMQALLKEQARLSKADRKKLDKKLERLIERTGKHEHKLLQVKATDNAS